MKGAGADETFTPEAAGDVTDPSAPSQPTDPQAKLSDYVTINGDGDVVISADVWKLYKDGWEATGEDYEHAYFRGLSMTNRYFHTMEQAVDGSWSNQVEAAYVEFWGAGTYRFVNHPVSATFRTDWQIGYWNDGKVNYNTAARWHRLQRRPLQRRQLPELVVHPPEAHQSSC